MERPEFFSSEQMVMDMEDNLSAVLPAVVNEPVPGLRNAELLRNDLRGAVNASDQLPIFRLGVVHGSDVLFGNNKRMLGGRRLNVVESEHLFVFVNFSGRDRAVDYFTENTIHTKRLLGIIGNFPPQHRFSQAMVCRVIGYAVRVYATIRQ
jgi:hypothetical protein